MKDADVDSAVFPQLRRSPIKKVRKSLALDIVDEDMTQNVPALPKTVCFKRAQVRAHSRVKPARAREKLSTKPWWQLCHLQLPLRSSTCACGQRAGLVSWPFGQAKSFFWGK